MTQPFSAAIERIKRLPSGRWLFFRRALVASAAAGNADFVFARAG